MSRTISCTELKSLLNTGDSPLLLDVRRKADLDADTVVVPDAQWLDPERLGEWSVELPRDREIVLYCVRGGSVSNSVVDRLRELGLKARYVEGGIAAWKEAGGSLAAKG